jgi:pyruvate-ferredoxin/flavodoxin oxidoreductase
VGRLGSVIGEELSLAILNADQSAEQGIFAQRQRVRVLKEKLAGINTSEARDLLSLADALVKRAS